MALNLSDLLTIFKDKPNFGAVSFAQKQSKLFTAHVTGIGNDELLEKIVGLESDKQLNLRKKFAKSNKDLFARIHRPEDKVFTAKGGSVYYTTLSETQKKEFIARLNNVYKGYSLKAWIEAFALQYFHIDPMGLIFIEVGKDAVAYPTYKSSSEVFDYKLKGRELEYVIFKTSKHNEFRVVDETRDYIVRFEQGEVIELANESYINYFGVVPALIISDILQENTEYYTSPDEKIIEVANEFLRDGSVKSIYKLKHGYPKAWQYESTCNKCKGTGYSEAEECEVCNGSGRQVIVDASEVLSLPLPTADQPAIAPNVAGYASPDIQGWDKMTGELTDLENLMHSTYWGIKDRVKANGIGNEKTATEIIDDMQPLNDRLSKFSKWAEGIEIFITNLLGRFYYSENFECSINYGKRYGLESYDTIWAKYEDARTKGCPISVLDDLLMEYYYSKYDSNSIELNKYLKLMKVEPFVHLTIKEGKDLIINVDDYNKKLYFGEFINQLNPNDIMIKSINELSLMLTNYVQAKVII